jgi:hypothetical protein
VGLEIIGMCLSSYDVGNMNVSLDWIYSSFFGSTFQTVSFAFL